MTGARFQPDCGRCAGLCCVAFAFDRSESFGIDKAVDEPCPNLGAGAVCAIHDHLPKAGFPGCAAYDCHGAGQVVVQEMFAGRSWQDDPALLAPMTRAFRAMCRVRERQVLLAEAGKLDLSNADRERLGHLATALEPEGGWTSEALEAADGAALDGASILREIDRFLGRLGRYVRRDEAASEKSW